ncbi:PREDICTED: uncharacterized protein LOC108617503 [Drosophila arizonae]|uniref:Uncharacterized protein LOC108617503 n=1 Tax=Drosophila arizonae TaxID=7263 RepID=A0ABM1PNL8_DROAR|nr:PREDICTED: uncharacterized protein LOC108617503 [Drosophila arizonae]
MTYLLFLILLANYAACSDVPKLTQTVYGFLDFTTTIGNTVMVFSPQSSPLLDLTPQKPAKPVDIIDTKPHVPETKDSKNGISPTPLLSSSLNEQPTANSTIAISSHISLLNTPIKSVDFSEYALLSRQPEEFAEETFRLVNLNTRADHSKRNNYGSSTGLLQRKKDSLSRSSNTPSKETAIITAKTLGKTSQIYQPISSTERRSKPRHTSTTSARVLKTVTPSLPNYKTPVESNHVPTKSTRKNSRVSGEKRKLSRNKGKRRNKSTQSSIIQVTPSQVETSSRRSYRTKTNLISEDNNVTNFSPSTLKLNRRPGRWQYKSSPKPKVNIRKSSPNMARSELQTEALKEIDPLVEPVENNPQIQKTIDLNRDLDAVGSQNTIVPDNDVIKPNNFVQTLNVEISTPSNFEDTYYEIATILCQFFLQAGLVKKTRFVTVTSTFEKTLKTDHIEEYSEHDGPLTENILESTTQTVKPSMDGIVTTLKPIHYTDSLETPELETITESFSFTQTKLKTQILPIINDKLNETSHITLVQTYDYTSFVTVTQTISPFRDNFVPAKNFKDFEGILDEAGSEINLDLEFGDESNSGQFEAKPNANGISNVTNAINPVDSELLSKSEIKPEILGQPNSVITTTRPIIKIDTVWESYVIPLVRGTESILRTLSKSVGEVKKTEFVTEVSTISLPVPPMSQFPYSINPFYNPLLGIPQPQLITSTSIYETLITATSSKVLKLTFGARTAYTTLFSTSVVPTAVSKLVTATIPIQNSGSFQNFYPPPYPPFAYVG